jgi:hypothetical protein
VMCAVVPSRRCFSASGDTYLQIVD